MWKDRPGVFWQWPLLEEMVAEVEAEDCRSWRAVGVGADLRWKLCRSEFTFDQSIKAVAAVSFLNANVILKPCLTPEVSLFDDEKLVPCDVPPLIRVSQI